MHLLEQESLKGLNPLVFHSGLLPLPLFSLHLTVCHLAGNYSSDSQFVDQGAEPGFLTMDLDERMFRGTDVYECVCTKYKSGSSEFKCGFIPRLLAEVCTGLWSSFVGFLFSQTQGEHANQM